MPTVDLKTESEAQLEAYLAEHGLEGSDDHQPDLGGGPGARRPDYRVSRSDSAAIIELKGFESSALQEALADAGGAITRGAEQELAQTRNKMLEAHVQLRPYRDRPEPLIVALANPRELWVPIEDVRDTIAAMYGDEAVMVPVDLGDGLPPDTDPEAFFDRNGVYGGGLHPYVSAVLTLHERTHRADAINCWHEQLAPRLDGIEDPLERGAIAAEATKEAAFIEAHETPGTYRFVRLYETHHVASTAPPVPRDLFTGPRDAFYAYNAENGNLELLGG